MRSARPTWVPEATYGRSPPRSTGFACRSLSRRLFPQYSHVGPPPELGDPGVHGSAALGGVGSAEPLIDVRGAPQVVANEAAQLIARHASDGEQLAERRGRSGVALE